MNTMTEAKYLAVSQSDEEPVPLADTITLSDGERQRCEVWTRVMGYHRPVASFNVGKKAEHAERRFFVESRAAAHC
jgi:hypothetical protein